MLFLPVLPCFLLTLFGHKLQVESPWPNPWRLHTVGKQPGHVVAHSELATEELHGGVQLDSAADPAKVL